MNFKVLDLGDDPENVGGYSGRNYYRLATITWSKPRRWDPAGDFEVPAGWAGHGGIYAFIRSHWRQHQNQIAYIGKAIDFQDRLKKRHQHFDIVKRQGVCSVSCGRVAFERIRSRTAYYLELEDLVKFAVWDDLENSQGLESLPGFRASQPRVMVPWVIRNRDHRFHGAMPRRIIYPAIGVEY